MSGHYSRPSRHRLYGLYDVELQASSLQVVEVIYDNDMIVDR